MMKTGNAPFYPIDNEPQARQSTGLLITGSAVRARPEEPLSSANHTRRMRRFRAWNRGGTLTPVRLFWPFSKVSRETSPETARPKPRPRRRIQAATIALTVSFAACAPADMDEPEIYTIECNGHRIQTTHHFDQDEPDATTWYRVDDHYEPAGRGVICTRTAD